MSIPREMSCTYLYKFPVEHYTDYIEAPSMVPLGSIVYIHEHADKENHSVRGPYIVRSIETSIKIFPAWTSQTIWIHLTPG